MEHAKKMILIEPETLQRYHQSKSEQLNPQSRTLSTLDQEMKTLIDNNNLPDHEKWLAYQQVLQKYLQIIENIRKPVAISIKTEGGEISKQLQTPPVQPTQDFTTILNTVPPRLRRKAEQLLEKLSNSNVVSWDDYGRVSIDGDEISRSNITDLINDTVRNRKASEPVGWREFTRGLAKLNIPFEYIVNEKRRKYILDGCVDPELSAAVNRLYESFTGGNPAILSEALNTTPRSSRARKRPSLTPTSSAEGHKSPLLSDETPPWEDFPL